MRVSQHGFALAIRQPADRLAPRSTPAGAIAGQHNLEACRKERRRAARGDRRPSLNKTDSLPMGRSAPKAALLACRAWPGAVSPTAGQVKIIPGYGRPSRPQGRSESRGWICLVVPLKLTGASLLRHTPRAESRPMARLRANNDGLSDFDPSTGSPGWFSSWRASRGGQALQC